ncbi:MAG: hypothetical protein Q9216_002098 [Gyalolechia sp. 2 TL-2023]
MSKKRRREQSGIDVQLVEIYEDLASENGEIRLKAAHAFLTKFSQDNNTSSDQLAEAVRRLLRGLCSGRKAARLGFSVTLTELLSQRWGSPPVDGAGELQLSELVDVLIKQSETTGKVSGQEERDHQFGRLFGAEAFIKSGVLFQPHASPDIWFLVLDIIYEIAKKKPWLREECGWVLYGTSQTLKDGHHDIQLVQAIIDKLCENALAKTPEGIAIWLRIQADFPNVHFPAGVWRHENPLHRKEAPKLARILKEASPAEGTDEVNGAVSQKGNWTSKIHFAWNVIFAKLADDDIVNGSQKKSSTMSFGEFWHQAVDESLFASSSSEERKYWGFLLFQQLFSSAPETSLPSLFTDNFKRCLINQLASKDRYLHLAAEKSTKSILKRVESEPSAAFAALDAFLAKSLPGNLSFDQVTKTKTLERLITLADDGTARRLVHELCSMLLHPGLYNGEDVATRRQMIADQLVSLLKSRQNTENLREPSSDARDLVTKLLNVLVAHSYFSVDPSASTQPEAPLPPISRKTQDMLRSRLSACLSHIMSKFPNPAYHIYDAACQIRANGVDTAMRSELDLAGPVGEGVSTAWLALEQVSKSLKADSGNKTCLEAFMLLYSLTVVQVYNGDADAVSILDELHNCYNLLIKGQGKEGQQGSEVLVEILLGFSAKPSQLFRRLTQQVFSAFTSDVDITGLQSMIKVLETRENLAGQDEMFEEENHDSEPSDDASSENSDVEEVEMMDANDIQSSSNKDESSEAASDSGEEADDSEDSELAAFDAKLAQALKTRPLTIDLDAASTTSSSSDMTDAQMEALDEHIAQIFKERKNLTKGTSRKTQQKDARESVVNFKCRVLDLLEIFIKQQHKQPVALEILMPLLSVTRTTTSQQVSSKACNLVREFGRICKGKEMPETDDSEKALGLLREVHVEAMREASNAHASACSQASLCLVRMLVGMDRENLRKVVEIYAGTQEALLMDPMCRVKMSLFTDWMNWCATARLGR